MVFSPSSAGHDITALMKQTRRRVRRSDTHLSRNVEEERKLATRRTSARMQDQRPVWTWVRMKKTLGTTEAPFDGCLPTWDETMHAE
jgi:hypothetical protein